MASSPGVVVALPDTMLHARGSKKQHSFISTQQLLCADLSATLYVALYAEILLSSIQRAPPLLACTLITTLCWLDFSLSSGTA